MFSSCFVFWMRQKMKKKTQKQQNIMLIKFFESSTQQFTLILHKDTLWEGNTLD